MDKLSLDHIAFLTTPDRDLFVLKDKEKCKKNICRLFEICKDGE